MRELTDSRKVELIRMYPILYWFRWEQLPEGKPRETSKLHHDLAFEMADKLERSAEVSAGLRHLLEAKDCLVRATIGQPDA